MQISIPIPTSEDIRAAVREELAAFFASNPFTQKPQEDDGDQMGGVDLAVAVTGKKPSTIYTLCSKRLIPHSKRGKQLYFSKRALLNWIQEGRRKTKAEIISVN